MTWVCDWLGNHVSHTHTDAEIHTSAKMYAKIHFISTVCVCMNGRTKTHTVVCGLSASKLWVFAWWISKSGWLTAAGSVFQWQNILHLAEVVLAAAEKPDCLSESLFACAHLFRFVFTDGREAETKSFKRDMEWCCIAAKYTIITPSPDDLLSDLDIIKHLMKC